MQEDNYVLYIKDLIAISHQGELEHFEQPHFIKAEFETTRGHSQIVPKQQKFQVILIYRGIANERLQRRGEEKHQ